VITPTGTEMEAGLIPAADREDATADDGDDDRKPSWSCTAKK
jgi:hypothetical protein